MTTQQTKGGNVSVISNIGGFGGHGTTRRLEPLEFGDASVPFGVNGYAMVWSNDAPWC
ncbi:MULTISPECIES: hypothetical protein [unclassified Massilia]|uniref:hypothetical protein n=1 Tax=unclassified Massilia TaxID=2609279 RepID=UPI0012E36F86|nr:MULTISPECIES: hypothetical protein [unclassified Massilia]